MGSTNDEALLPARKVQLRYDIADRTLDRWLSVAGLNLPRPVVINRRRYFKVDELRTWERQRAAGGAS